MLSSSPGQVNNLLLCKSHFSPGEGGRGRAAGQGMFFWPRCPKQGIQFDLPLPYTGSETVLNRVWYYEPRDFNPEYEQDLMVFCLN